MKKGFSPPGIIRQQGESMGGAYDALHEHKSVKRRAQSAGLQRSASATPRSGYLDSSTLSAPCLVSMLMHLPPGVNDILCPLFRLYYQLDDGRGKELVTTIDGTYWCRKQVVVEYSRMGR